MQGQKYIKISNLLMMLVLIFSSVTAASNVTKIKTIQQSSWLWSDDKEKDIQLKTIPKWHYADIKNVFDTFKDKNKLDLPLMINGVKTDYPALFIHALWGPIENPFTTLVRPAKLFMFYETSDEQQGHLWVPIVEEETSGEYYVFDLDHQQPLSLFHWVFLNLKGDVSKLKFSVCAKYGSAPDHVCNDTAFENEIHNYPDDTDFRDDFHQSIKSFGMMGSERKKGVDWRQYDKSYQLKQSFSPTSIVRSSIPWEVGDEKDSLLSRVTSWKNFETIERNFKAIRDLRYFKDESVPDFQRRISWLYPDDGCWTRLGAVMKDFFGPHENPINPVSRPSKIYVFGNLCTLTDNHPEGSAQWWYHAAPIVQDEELKHYYVLDPSVNDDAPIQVDEWVEMITSEVQACSDNELTELKFNICNGYGINPYDVCERVLFENFGKEISAELIQRYYRRFERSRQIELVRNPEVVLGEQPPWYSHQRHQYTN